MSEVPLHAEGEVTIRVYRPHAITWRMRGAYWIGKIALHGYLSHKALLHGYLATEADSDLHVWRVADQGSL